VARISLCEKKKKKDIFWGQHGRILYISNYLTHILNTYKDGNFFECVYRATELLSGIQEKRVYYEGASFVFLQTRDEEMTTRESRARRSGDDVQK